MEHPGQLDLWHVPARRHQPAQRRAQLRSPTLYELVSDGEGGEKRVVEQTATLAAREKLATIKERFRSWVFAEPEAYRPLGAPLQQHLQHRPPAQL